jgi:hypothetical protein
MLHLLLIIKNKNTLIIDKTCPLNKDIHEMNARIQRRKGWEFQNFGENEKRINNLCSTRLLIFFFFYLFLFKVKGYLNFTIQ